MRAAAILAGAIGGLCAGGIASAQQAEWLPIPPNAVYQTGDSWTHADRTFRLYGVQACLRGASFTNASGIKRDCGEASLAMLIAMVRDLEPRCHAVTQSQDGRFVLVICMAMLSKGRGAGSNLDLGVALITAGYAFAALKPDGQPVHPPYAVAQRVAEQSKAGLWAFPDLPEPNAMILRAMRQRSQTAR